METKSKYIIEGGSIAFICPSKYLVSSTWTHKPNDISSRRRNLSSPILYSDLRVNKFKIMNSSAYSTLLLFSINSSYRGHFKCTTRMRYHIFHYIYYLIVLGKIIQVFALYIWFCKGLWFLIVILHYSLIAVQSHGHTNS